jgi:hypothetical protein
MIKLIKYNNLIYTHDHADGFCFMGPKTLLPAISLAKNVAKNMV